MANNEIPDECPNCRELLEGNFEDTGLICPECSYEYIFKAKRTITLSVIYGSFNKGCRLHVVDDSTGRRLGDNRIPQYNLGRAGTFKSVDCKRCRRKMDALIKDPDVTVVDGWTGEEAA